MTGMGQPSFSLYVFGRLHGLPRTRLPDLVSAAGGRLVDRARPGVTIVAVAHGTARRALADGLPAKLPPGVPADADVISEISVRRLLGLEPPQAPERRMFHRTEMAMSAGVRPELIDCLSLYDVLDPAGGWFGYRDLVAARQVKRLVEQGFTLPDIIQASAALRRSGRTLSDTRLAETPWGEIVQELDGTHARLNGQLALSLDEQSETADEVFERGEECERSGDCTGAELWYSKALRMNRSDPVVPFNLGNVLDAAGREQEAVHAYFDALRRDPGFAEAWVNLGTVRERQDRSDDARECYSKALSVRPDCPEALFNLGRMLTRAQDYAAALPLWRRYLKLSLSEADLAKARRYVQLCEIGIQAAA